MPAAWTRPSQMYRYRSSLLRGGADKAASWTAIPPARIRATAHRPGIWRTSQAPPANTAHNVTANGTAPSLVTAEYGCTDR